MATVIRGDDNFDTAYGQSATVRVTKAVSQSIATGSPSYVSWDTTVFDPDNLHSSVTNTTRLTAATAGKYLVGSTIVWAEIQNHMILIALQKNGAYITGHEQNTPTAGSQLHNSISVTTLIDLDVGDYVEVVVEQRSGSAVSLINVSPTNSFWMTYVSK